MQDSLTAKKITFLIETGHQGKDVALVWSLTQAVPLPAGQREEARLYNQVQKHLHSLSTTTGFDYSILYWGYPEMADEYIEEKGITLY